MSRLKIKDMPPVEVVDGTEIIPTGGKGDVSVTVERIKNFVYAGTNFTSLASQLQTVDLRSQNNKVAIESHIADLLNPHQVNKAQVGLGNVDNTSDLNKPISTATQAALTTLDNTKANMTYVDAGLNTKANITYVDDNLALKENLLALESVDLTPSSSFDNVKNTNNLVIDSTNQSLLNRTEYLKTHNNLVGRDVANAHPANAIVDASGKTQQEINDSILGTLSKKFTQYSTLSEAKSSTSLSVNTTIYVNGFSAAGDGGAALWDVIPAETVDNYTIVSLNDDPTIVLRLNKNQTVNPLMVGASTVVGFDNAPHLNALLKYKNVVIPEGTFEVAATVFASENSTVEFYGWIKTKAGVRLDTLFAASKPNITLINPLLDGNRDNTPVVSGNGIVHVLANYGTGINLKVRGGQIINGGHNIFQGGRSGLDIKGTKMSRCGEHIIYLNAVDNGQPAGKHTGTMRFTDVTLDTPALESFHSAGNYVQLRNAGTVILDGIKASGAGTVSNTFPTIGVLATNVDKVVVKNSDFKDITSNAIWFGQDATLGGGKDIYVDNCTFNAITSTNLPLFKITTISGGSAIFTNSESTSFYILNNDTPSTSVIIENFKFNNVSSEMLIGGNTTILNSLLGFINLAGRAMRVYNGLTIIKNSILTGTSSISIFVDTDASLDIDNLRLPDKTSGQVVQTNNVKFMSIKNCYAPLNTGNFIQVPATNTSYVFVIGNLAPQATLSILGTAPISAANKFLN